MFSNGDNGPDRIIFSDWGPKQHNGVPFSLVDPQDGRVPNVILLHGAARQQATIDAQAGADRFATRVRPRFIFWVPSAVGASHSDPKGHTPQRVRLKYADGEVEDHKLLNGVHFADYIRRSGCSGIGIRVRRSRPTGALPEADAETPRTARDDRVDQGRRQQFAHLCGNHGRSRPDLKSASCSRDHLAVARWSLGWACEFKELKRGLNGGAENAE